MSDTAVTEGMNFVFAWRKTGRMFTIEKIFDYGGSDDGLVAVERFARVRRSGGLARNIPLKNIERNVESGMWKRI